MAGFVSGTLVHTDKGLVPIQEVKVGDLVCVKSTSDELIGGAGKRNNSKSRAGNLGDDVF